MTFYSKFVNVDSLKTGTRLNAFNGGGWEKAFFEIRITSNVLAGVVLVIENAPAGFGPITLTEGVDWNAGANVVASLQNLANEIAAQTDSPWSWSEAAKVDPDTPTAAYIKLEAKQRGYWGSRATMQVQNPNGASISINRDAGPHAAGLLAQGGGVASAEDQMSEIIANLDPAPADITKIRIHPANPDYTQWLVVWEV